MKTLRPCFLLFSAACFWPLAAAGKTFHVTVEAAAVERRSQVITIDLPVEARTATALRTTTGALWPLQVESDGRATFIVPVQRKDEKLKLELMNGQAAGAGLVAVRRQPGSLQLTVNGAPALGYQMDAEALPRADIKPEYKRAGYLHPLLTPAGTLVSDDYPPQHIHHHGVWSPWTKTTFQGREPDFWNMGKKTGTVEFAGLDWTWQGPVHGGFVARHRMVDLSATTPVTALHEVWQVTLYAAQEARVFDLTLTQVCATNSALGLPQYHYGGLGYRAPGEWYGKDKANFLTSEGETDRVKANARKMRWVHVGGAVPGGMAGVAILGHPGNFRAPQPVRVHPNEPYVSFTPSQDGDWSIEPGGPYVARYRFVALDGAPDRAQLEAFWNGYATPAAVTLVAAP